MLCHLEKQPPVSSLVGPPHGGSQGAGQHQNGQWDHGTYLEEGSFAGDGVGDTLQPLEVHMYAGS